MAGRRQCYVVCGVRWSGGLISDQTMESHSSYARRVFKANRCLGPILPATPRSTSGGRNEVQNSLLRFLSQSRLFSGASTFKTSALLSPTAFHLPPLPPPTPPPPIFKAYPSKLDNPKVPRSKIRLGTFHSSSDKTSPTLSMPKLERPIINDCLKYFWQSGLFRLIIDASSRKQDISFNVSELSFGNSLYRVGNFDR